MRFDSIGMFWEDRPTARGKNKVFVQPPIPDTGWRPPVEFPDLSGCRAIALDTETFDPELKASGPGWARGVGHIAGVSLAVPDGRSWYFPMRHTIESELNMDPEKVLAYLRHTLSGSQPKVGANLVYDIGWLREEGVAVGGALYDVQFAEALLMSETPDVSLDALAKRYLGVGKTTEVLYEWLSRFYGGPPTGSQRKNIYRATPRLVGPYAEGDAAQPLAILEKQWPLLEKRGVLDLFNMECGLIRLLVEMRALGAPVDVAEAERFSEEIAGGVVELQREIKRLVGFEVNINASASIEKAFGVFGLKGGLTPTGKPSFTAGVLENIDHQLPRLLLEQRRLEKIKGTFIDSYILKNQVKGRVHCSFHPLKGDGYGARSGRFASADPNLQNIPVRTELGKRIRTIFAGVGVWRKYDYSQIEYRLLAHHAVGAGAAGIRQRYQDRPDVDYHEAIIDLLLNLTGIELGRRPAKTINFGLIYGMSAKELIRRLGLGNAKGREVFNAYHVAAPFAKATAEAMASEASATGHITTLLGRKSDFPFFGPAQFSPDAPAYPLEVAIAKYGQVERAYTHKALNRKLQGGAADIMKKAMYDCYVSGVFDQTGYPCLTVHDELDFDDLGAPADAWSEMKHIMETGTSGLLTVPLLVDEGVGPNWGAAD